MQSCPLLSRTNKLILGNFTKKIFYFVCIFSLAIIGSECKQVLISSVANSNYLKLKES